MGQRKGDRGLQKEPNKGQKAGAEGQRESEIPEKPAVLASPSSLRPYQYNQ